MIHFLAFLICAVLTALWAFIALHQEGTIAAAWWFSTGWMFSHTLTAAFRWVDCQ